MKNKLMLLIVLAGISTAVYRFLPADLKSRVDTQLHKVAQVTTRVSGVPSAAANPAQKKYVLDIPDTTASVQSGEAVDLVNAFMQHQSNVQVRAQGKVIKILFDDTKGSRHQRFIVRTEAGFTILIAHNIDLAPRINSLAEGDNVSFCGEYEWNEKGGVVHWTHRDPRGHHIAGWIKHKGVNYQ
ncbi:hypothetical protein GCM10011613_33430 [Cellvibrio zantedeschiae]|uniref:DUF3465 domain-containing protein n=1 Tax=Cellvibrio zantedeschiae TaxID=1237077 RepID=A0ABQ3BB04_9GAMM|nr:DUF3465 domain-containing protein [Cellvibrio zantedeschiae]GGY85789.1 hypothetical protein GCM10011613_33430 [Cellvibrio zantedeschiae]